jgi:hypothetical protein
MIQAIIIQDTNFLIPNKEHKNFTDSSESAKVGSIVTGEFRNVNGLRKGKPFEYRLFFANNGKILYANCVKTESVSSEIISNADNLQATTMKPTNQSKLFVLLVGGIAGYLYGKQKKVDANTLITYIAVGSVGAYGIHYLITKNKSTTNKPSK